MQVPTFVLTTSSLAIAKRTLSRNLGLGSGHLSESLASGLGYRSHAALLAALRKDSAIAAEPCAARFTARLTSLGQSPDAAHAEMAFLHALDLDRDGFGFQSPGARLLQLAYEMCRTRTSLVMSVPWTHRIVTELAPVPDPTVPTMRVDRKVLRWNPDFVASLTWRELRFLIAAACLHHRMGHPSRRQGRDARLWQIACEYAVNHALRDWGDLSDLPRGAFYDRRFHSRVPVEQIYDAVAEEHGGNGKRAMVDFGSWEQPGRKWPAAGCDAIVTGKPSWEAWPGDATEAQASKWLMKASSAKDCLLDAILSGTAPSSKGMDEDDALQSCYCLARRAKAVDDPGEQSDAFGNLLLYALENFGLVVTVALARYGMYFLRLRPNPDRPGMSVLTDAMMPLMND